MKDHEPDEIRALVRERYGAIANGDAGGCCPSQPTDRCCGGEPRELGPVASTRLGYSTDELAAVPADSDLGLGCGNPQAIAALRPGETVLDLGSGAGLDGFLAARQVGPTGRVIGVDMTPEMIAKARENARRSGTANVEFRLGEIEHLPVADASVDVIISNCVVNLSPDKPAVWRDALRALRPGGRLAISDVVALAPLPPELCADPALHCACVSGAVDVAALERQLLEAGFTDIRVTPRAESREFIRDWSPGLRLEDYVGSATIEARKPAGPGRPEREALRLEDAAGTDADGIGALLTHAGLPVPGPQDRPVSFLVARAGGQLLGCVGWESYGERALLRSLAVHPASRGGGVGRALVEALHARLAAAGAHEVILLTTGAALWFCRLGYAVVRRDEVPASVCESREFALDCCRTATCMRRPLAGPASTDRAD